MKKALSFFITLSMLLTFFVNAAADDGIIACSNIKYTDAYGNIVTALSTQPIIAKVKITENTTDKEPALIVCSYESGVLSGIWYSKDLSNTDEISVPFTLTRVTENTVVEATVLESLYTLKSSSTSARLSEDSLELSVLKVGGDILEGYSDGTDSYKKLVSPNSLPKLEVIPKDSGTKVEISNVSSVPGIAGVSLTSPSGNQREIDILLYSDPAQLSKPSGISYKIGNVNYEVENFNPETTQYTVELPNNTFYVTVEPEVLEVTDVSVKVLDVDHSTKKFGVIDYTAGSTLSTAYKTLFNPRPVVNNRIPIKNEETKALIYTGYDDETYTYTITFKSKQPRLTSFNMSADVKEKDKYFPIFMGGAAANNDNGSAAGTDRAWTVTNIPDQLIGSSMFATMLRTNDSGQAGNDWYETNTSGEYFNFKADTSGTLYIISSAKFANSEYTIENSAFAADGKWRLLSEVPSSYIPEGYTSWKDVPRTFGSYGNGVYFARVIQYQGQDRFENGALIGNIGSLVGSSYRYTYARSFEAGEEVKVFHPGNSSFGVIFVKWNIE